jgi:hypothetical protein
MSLPPGQAANWTVAVAVGQESASPIRGAVLLPELLEEPPPDELPLEDLAPEELPLEDEAPEELLLDTPPPELLELLELLDEDPPPLLDDPPAAGPATTP